MLDIVFNGQPTSVALGSTIQQLLSENNIAEQFCAVERNEEIVARTQFSSVQIQSGDQIEVVTFVGGG